MSTAANKDASRDTGKGIHFPMLYRTARLGLAAALLALLAACATTQTADSPTDSTRGAAPVSEVDLWHSEALDWRQSRHERLVAPWGWLSLVGLDFLEEGRYRVGQAEQMDIHMPAGPEFWGELVVTGSRARFEPASDAVSVDGRAGVAGMLVQPGRNEPVWVQAEDVRFQILHHSGRMAVRTRWPQAETRTEFSGLDYFSFSPDWRVEARFLPHPKGTTMPVGSVLGVITQEPNPGVVEFDVHGQTHRLEAVLDSGQLFFIFADTTSGRSTYGGGRMLYAERPDRRGYTVLDFNRAYNPPCVFTEYSTCPLPPPENYLQAAVEAGEKRYAGQTGYLE